MQVQDRLTFIRRDAVLYSLLRIEILDGKGEELRFRSGITCGTPMMHDL